MARPGYIEARQRFYTAEADIDDAKQQMATVETYPPDHWRRIDRQKHLEKCQIEFDAAEQAWAPFRPQSKTTREYYPDHFWVNKLAVSRELGNLIRAEEDKGVALPEIIRRALQKYFADQNAKAEDEVPF